MELDEVAELLAKRLSTKRSVEDAAKAVGISAATLYRYKSNPESIDLGKLVRLVNHLGLPLQNGAVWSKPDVLGSERRRLELETQLSKGSGRRITTIPTYSVNDELSELTRLRLGIDYGTRAASIEEEVMAFRSERCTLYDQGRYESWEIWNGFGYGDFYHGRGEFKDIPDNLRHAQIERLIESSLHPSRHRFIYLRNAPDLPMFGCYSPPDVALVRVDDIHLEFQAPALVHSFEETFNDFLDRCSTKTSEQFISFLKNPQALLAAAR